MSVIGVGDINAIPDLFRLTKRKAWLKQDSDEVLINLQGCAVNCMHLINTELAKIEPLNLTELAKFH